MTQGSLLGLIADTPWASWSLAATFDFDVTDPGHTPLEALHLASGQRLEAVARDAGAGRTSR